MNYSSKKIPLYPYLSYDSIDKFPNEKEFYIPNIADTGIVYSTLNARSALEIGISSLKLKKGDEILFPAYHSPTTVYASLKAGGKPVFYKINPGCSINIADIEKKITSRTKAVLVVHYFGFPNSLSQIRDICNNKKIYLIEDCAHAFYGYCDNLQIGSIGDFSIASLWKFFPVHHGGVLKYRNKEIANGISMKTPSLFYQLKSALNSLERGNESRHSGNFRKFIFSFKDKLWARLRYNKINYTPPSPTFLLEKKSANNYLHELAHENYSSYEMPFFSKFIYKMTNKENLIYQRRQNFSILLKEFKSVVGIKPLFNELPPNVVPYVFPIISNNTDELVKQLKSQRVNISRFGEHPWDDMDKKICDVSFFYSKHCIQLPIHQSLTLEDMKYMIDVIKNIYV